MKKTTWLCSVMAPCCMLGISLAYAGQESGHGPMHGPLEERMFKEADQNGDGAISRAEFDKFQGKHFKRMDANGDGKITYQEMEAGHQKRKESASSHLDRRFKAADADNDGGLGREEAKAMPMLSMYFDEVDSNKDGKVTRQEYMDAMPLLHRARQNKADSL